MGERKPGDWVETPDSRVQVFHVEGLVMLCTKGLVWGSETADLSPDQARTLAADLIHSANQIEAEQGDT